MKIQEEAVKENIIKRLSRIEGQVRGIQTMLKEERDCQEIMQQLSAIHSAIQGVSRLFLQEYATACLIELDDQEGKTPDPKLLKKREKIVQEMINLLNKAP